MSRRLKIILTIVVVVLVIGFFLLGRTAYFIAGSVSCGVTGVYSDLNNNPSSFSTDWDKYSSLDFSEYYMNDFESFNITNGEITLSGWWCDNKDSEKTVTILTEFSHLIRKALSKKIHMKFLPKVSFISDKSFDYAEKIEKLIQKNK